jgi:hypothetical protein
LWNIYKVTFGRKKIFIYPLKVGEELKANEWLSEAQWCEVTQPWTGKDDVTLSQGSGCTQASLVPVWEVTEISIMPL